MAALVSLGWLAVLAPAAAGQPPSWAVRLEWADAVSHQGYADSTFADRAQDSALGLAEAILVELSAAAVCDSAACRQTLALMGDFALRDRDYARALAYWEEAGAYGGAADLDLSLRPCLLMAVGADQILDGKPAQRARERCRLLSEDCPPDSLELLWRFTHLCESNWLLADVQRLHERIVAIQTAHPDADARWAIRSLVTLAEFASKRLGIPHTANPVAMQDSAIALASHALELARRRYGVTDTLFAYVADRLGDYHARLGKRTIAWALWDSAWTANRLHLAPEHIEHQGNLDRMCSVRRAQGRYQEAEQLALQALELRRKARGEGHPEVAYMHINLARIYHATGQYRRAERAYREALRIREAAIERSAPLLAESHRQLGQLYFDEGRYAEADENFHTAIALTRESLGEMHSLSAACLRDLASLQTTWGRPDDAAAALREAVDIQSLFLGPTHPAVAATLEDLARVELLLGHLAPADSAITRALAIGRENALTQGPPSPATLSTQARVCLAAGQRDEAAIAITQALALRDLSPAAPNPERFADLTLLARIETERGNWDRAVTAYRQIFTLDSSYGGLNLAELADAREQYARQLIVRGDASAAMPLAAAALDLRLRLLDEGGRVLSEHQALRFEQAMHRTRDVLLSACLTAGALTDSTTGLLLAAKGAVSNRIFERERDTRRASAPEMVALRDSLHYARHRLATLYLRGPGTLAAAEYTALVDSVHHAKEDLEDRLTRRLGTLAAVPSASRITVAGVRAAMPAGAALIEYFRFANAAAEGREEYAALAMPRSGALRLVALGAAESIDSLVADGQSHMIALSAQGAMPTESDQRQYTTLARALYDRIWQPLAGAIPAGEIMLVAPDASLHLVSFASLVDADGRFLIESTPLHYLACGRSLLDPRGAASGTGALVVCDPDFDADARLRAQAQPATVWAASTEAPSDFVTLRASCDLLTQRQLARLPGTRSEADGVEMAWRAQSSEPVEVFAGAAASEENVKRHARGRRVLHLATHGFYLGDRCRPHPVAGETGPFDAMIGENPLLLSGLCLAGAACRADAGLEDGLLTAEEVASLPLDGVRWAVLSACETRLGAPRSGEGIFGLQRAFQMAGVGTVISSLWTVSDRMTSSFMRRLYAGSRDNLPTLMRDSQLATIAELRRRGQPDHPYLWGAFVAVGAWEPLD
ncbi:MAG TPA: CHAT domain-containing tetratricopeptide repeat protein [bacterium]|nr:CHAT domain-containing tetratricopeptide repeat protein [bacterium]